MRARLRILSAATLCGVLSSGCQGGGDNGGDTTRDTTTAARETATATPAPAAGGEPSYDVDPRNVAAALRFDSATNTVTYPIVAGLTSANNAWNFNGYANGNMTVIVPVGAKVVIPFSNLDGNVPHSLGVIAGSTTNLVTVPDQPLIFGASTRRYETGIRSVERDVVRFTASEAGEYLMVCGVPGHAAGGMWIRFQVSSRVTQPEIRTRS